MLLMQLYFFSTFLLLPLRTLGSHKPPVTHPPSLHGYRQMISVSPPEAATEQAGPPQLIATQSELAAAVEELQGVTCLALDTEHHSEHSYLGLTCLIQLSTGEQ